MGRLGFSPTNRQESPWRMRYGRSGDTTFALPEYDGTLQTGGWTKEGTTAWEYLDHGGDVVVVKKMELVMEMIASPMEPSTTRDDAEPTSNTQPTNSTQPTNITNSGVVVGSVYQDDSHLPPPAGTASKVQRIAADKYRPWSPKRRRASWTKLDLGMDGLSSGIYFLFVKVSSNLFLSDFLSVVFTLSFVGCRG